MVGLILLYYETEVVVDWNEEREPYHAKTTRRIRVCIQYAQRRSSLLHHLLLNKVRHVLLQHLGLDDGKAALAK